MNLFAACRQDDTLIAKRVRLDASVQQHLARLFEAQEQAFRRGVTNEVPFDGHWTPEEDEFLTIDVPEEALIFRATIAANAVSIPDLDTANFEAERVKALFTGTSTNGDPKVLIQRFTSQQHLGHKRFTLLQSGNAFRQLSDPAFSLASSLTALIEDGKIKFKSQHNLRGIINLTEIYREATADEVRTFAAHDRVLVDDVSGFVSATNQVTRKLIHALSSSGVLDNCTASFIQSEAKATGLELAVRDDKIVFPADKADIKAVLQFLNECRFQGPLSRQTFLTNSRRPA